MLSAILKIITYKTAARFIKSTYVQITTLPRIGYDSVLYVVYCVLVLKYSNHSLLIFNVALCYCDINHLIRS